MYQDFIDTKYDDILVVDIKIPDATLRHAQKFKNYIQRLINNGERKIIINCQDISYIDSTFLGSLVFLLKKIATVGGDLRLILNDVESPIWTMFETTRMFKVFKTYPDTETAIGSFN